MIMQNSGPWTGASGYGYIYHVFEIDADIPARPGNFIYARLNQENTWIPVYMGQGDLATRPVPPDLMPCIRAKGATHVHLRLNRRPEDRVAELDDLLLRYLNVFAPEGCQAPADQKEA
jgi:hypothetical protein